MIKLGIIGSGFGQYGHFPAFLQTPNCEIVAHCGESRPQLEEYFARIGFTSRYTDWRKMLAEVELDALAIAVTPQAQVEICRLAIPKKLHIFAEKPLAVNSQQAQELLELATTHGITHGLDFIFPEINAWKSIKALLESEQYGQLKHLTVTWDFLSFDLRHAKPSWKSDVSQGGGALSYYFSHGLHYIEHFAGPIKTAQAHFTHADAQPLGESGADLKLEFTSGATGEVHLNSHSQGETRHQLVFECEAAEITLRNSEKVVNDFEIIIKTASETSSHRSEPEMSDNGEDERVKIVAKLADRFIRACQQGEQTSPSFADGLRVQQILEELRK